MTEELFADRRKGQEEAFFAKQDEEARQKLRRQEELVQRRGALRDATGIADDGMLDALLAHGIDAETTGAFALLPLADVAWADGRVEDAERDAVLTAAAGTGVVQPGLSLLESWLTTQPEEALRETWRAYAAALAAGMDAPARDAWRQELLGNARAVAAASGGFLGFGSKVSGAEEAVLLGIEAALR